MESFVYNFINNVEMLFVEIKGILFIRDKVFRFFLIVVGCCFIILNFIIGIWRSYYGG